MLRLLKDIFDTIRTPHLKKVFFKSLPLNRKIILWYAGKVVKPDSVIEFPETLKHLNDLRKQGRPITFICNHLSYADSHVIEALLIRHGFRELADHLIHIAGQKTFEFSRRAFTRSLNTVRVYQPKAKLEKSIKKKMNSRALKWAGHLKRRQYSLLVYPEGTRTRRHKRFNLRGANPRTTIYFRDSYVVPLALMGSEQLMPVGKILQRPATVRLRVGEPVDHKIEEETLRKQYMDEGEAKLREITMLHYMRQIDSLLDPEYRSAIPP